MKDNRIITGLPPKEDEAEPLPTLPRLRTFWVLYFNHENGKKERMTLNAHEIQVVSTGMLIFTAHEYSDDPAFAAIGQTPLVTRYVQGFKDFLGFGEIVTKGSVN